MTKKHNRNLIGFRTPSEKEKDRIKKEAEELDVSLYDLVNLGLELKKASNNERTILAKKKLEIAKRNDYLIKARYSNLRIEAYNKRLKYLNSDRYKDLSKEENVIDLDIFKELLKDS